MHSIADYKKAAEKQSELKMAEGIAKGKAEVIKTIFNNLTETNSQESAIETIANMLKLGVDEVKAIIES